MNMLSNMLGIFEKFLLHQILNTKVIYKSHALKCFTHPVIILQVMLLRVLMMLLLMLISSIFKVHILRMPLPFLFSLHCLICCIDSCISPFWYDWKVETKLVEVKYIIESKGSQSYSVITMELLQKLWTERVAYHLLCGF